MGRTNVVYFRHRNNSDYYMCKFCLRHVALHQDFKFTDQDNEVNGGIFTTVYNVKVDEARHHHQVGRYTIADIYCVNCKDKLGYKYIQVGSGPTQIRKGDLKLIMGKLMRRQGDELVDMATYNGNISFHGSEDNFIWIIKEPQTDETK